MKKRFYVLIFLFLGVSAFAQNNLYVFQTKGNVSTSQNIRLKKGDEINANTTVIIKDKSSLTCVDKSGNTYISQKTGTYKLPQILKNKKEAKSNITITFFKYVWNEFVNNKNEQSTIGGVFRGKEKMQFPIDSSRVAVSDIVLKWQGNQEAAHYFVFVKKAEDDDFIMLKANDTLLNLSKEISLEPNQNWIWTVSEKEFPNLNNLPYFSFRTISEKQYKTEIKKYKPLMKELKKMKLSKEEINAILCEEYKICE